MRLYNSPSDASFASTHANGTWWLFCKTVVSGGGRPPHLKKISVLKELSELDNTRIICLVRRFMNADMASANQMWRISEKLSVRETWKRQWNRN